MNAHGQQSPRLEHALNNLRRALEAVESAMVEFEEELYGQSSVRPLERRGMDLLSIPEVCQELGMGKSWLYRKLRSGEIPSIKLGRVIKVKRSSLEEYLTNQAVQQAQDLADQTTDQARGSVGQVAGQVAQGEQRIMGRAVDVGRAAEGLAGTAEIAADITKAARRKAEALGVDLSNVPGSGIGGRITIRDVVGAAS
jgi:excisionase family DNA binding protein